MYLALMDARDASGQIIKDLARTFHLTPAIFFGLTVGLTLVAAIVAGFVIKRFLHIWTKRFRGTWGEYLFSLLESMPVPLLILAALYGSMELLELPPQYDRLGGKLILSLLILVVFLLPAKILILFLNRVEQQDPHLERVTQPAAFFVRLLFALLTGIVLLDNLGISLTGVWTTLGIGSVAVALALQETLSNFFAGIYLLMDRPVAAGDYIRLESGVEGTVQKIGWRSTLLRTLGNNHVVIPNSTMSKAIITNFSMPLPRMGFGVQVSIAYGTDPHQVEKILLEVAQEAIQQGVTGLLADPPPSVAFNPGFGNSSMDFTLGVQIRQFSDQFLVQSELRKLMVARLGEEGIEIPFPTRTVVLEKSTQEALSRREKSHEP